MSESRNVPKLPFGDVEMRAAMITPEEAAATVIRGVRARIPGCFSKLLENVSKETVSRVVVMGKNLVAGVFDNGNLVGCIEIMPNITDVKVISKDNRPQVIIVTFADNTKEKAVLDENDTYSLEQGISICITKKLLGKNTSYGSSLYNKVIKHAINVMVANEKAAKDVKVAEDKAKEKAAKLNEKERKRKAKRAASKREYEIEVQKEAYIRAMKQLQEENRAEMEKSMEEVGNFFDELLRACEEEAAETEKIEQVGEESAQTVLEMNEAQN